MRNVDGSRVKWIDSACAKASGNIRWCYCGTPCLREESTELKTGNDSPGVLLQVQVTNI